MLPLASVDQFVAYADADGSDALIPVLLDAYSSAVRSYTNRDWTVESYSRSFDGANNTRQLLPQWPLITVSAVAIDGRDVAPAGSFDAAGYRFDDQSIILNGQRFGRGTANVAISWTAGYPTVPYDITQAVLEWTAVAYTNRGDKLGWSSMTLAQQTVTLITKSMPDRVKIMLDNRRAVVPL